MLALAAWLVLGTLPATAADAPLSICLPENDPPRSVRGAGMDAHGLDVDVARLLAAKLERSLRLAWMPERAQTDIESTDLDFRPLLRGECDALLSMPGTEAFGRLQNRLALSAPYYGAGYELVPAGAAFRWGEPYAGTIAVSANSLAHVAVNAIGVRWTMQEASADVVAALNAGTASAGLVWGPDLALLTDAHRSTAFDPPTVLRWNLHAATRRDDPVLADLNRVFAQDGVQRDILALLSRHRIPNRPPFETAHTRAALTALRNLSSP